MAKWRILPRATRWRVAVLATVASAAALGGGAFWFAHTLHTDLFGTASQVAEQKRAAVIALLDSGVPLQDLPKRLPDGGYELWAAPFDKISLSCPLNLGPAVHCTDQWEVPRPDDANGFAYGASAGQHFDLVTWAPVDPVGLETVRTTEKLLWGIVPVTALLIGAIAWFAVRRSLRAVEGIRAEVSGRDAGDFGHRVPVPDSGDEITGLAVTMNDMLARLDRSVRRQSQFTADASHELRSPIASMRTQLEVLLAHPDRIDWRTTAGGLVLDLDRMQDLVADLLLLSRLDAGEADGHEPVALGSLVTNHLASREPRAGVRFAVHAEADPVVEGHPARLERVLRNLVDNAERHAESAVTIAVGVEGDECVLSVEDDGQGIPEADRERVFDRFVRLDDDRSRDDGGAGLGLAIAAQIAAEHHGRLAVTAASRFELRLPLA